MVTTIKEAGALVTMICHLPGNDQFVEETDQLAKQAGLRKAVKARDTHALLPSGAHAQDSHAPNLTGAPLIEGGLPLIGRNRGRISRDIPSSVFKRQGEKLVLVRDLMGGAPEKELALRIRLVSPLLAKAAPGRA